ncbi:MAG TPA: hypothetical protein VFY29_06435 [Terriglobia bacterium]|nr:hypothetical protein [Terriglobia bacterium]
MMSHAHSRTDRGIALFVVMFALLFLSVVALGMMYATNTETAINANYKDAQLAAYGAMSGLQEMRDRIQPAILNITPPVILPSTTASGVIYLINPRTGETVAPWDINNRYADTELCQENLMGLTGTIGVPCTSLPSGTAWYTVYDDSQSSAGVWQQTRPLDFKWVRLTLKKNNNTAAPANGDSTSTNQVCWDGERQIMLPNGYGPECNRIGSIVAVNVTNGGTNYTSAPTVTLDAPPSGGLQATAHANMVPITDQQVSSVTVNSAGSGYVDVPIVTLSGGTGTGATAHVCILASECAQPFAPLSGASVASVTLTSAGTQCYATAPAVSFTGGGGIGAAAAATLESTSSCIQSVTYSGTCNAHKGETISGVGFSGGPTGSSGFSATLTFGGTHGEVTAMTIQNSGTGFSSLPTTITGFSGCTGMTFIANLGKRVSSLSLVSGGSGYTSTPTVGFTTGTGTSQTLPAATTTLGAIAAWAGTVTSIIVDNPGSGYTVGGGEPAVVLTAATGSGAAATANLGPVGGTNYYKVGSITIDQEGYGYTVDPGVTISGGGGSGAVGDATLGRGAKYGKVYLLTALAQTRSGARSFVQMETATPLTGFNATGALTVDGPNPVVGNMPGANNFYVHGEDANSCGQTAEPTHPAVGAYDDPNADPPTTSTTTLVNVANNSPGPDHYTGEGGTSTTPSVKNVYNTLGETMGTTVGLKALIDGVNAKKTNVGNTVSLGTEGAPAINYIDGDLTLNGSNTGYGILVVTGTLTMSGNFNWKGTILVVGDGIFGFSGGGSGQITGMLFVAKIWDSYTTKNLLAELGSPELHWNGGGNNGITYDHCWTTNLMSKVPFEAPPSTKPLKILSTRTLP